MGDARRVGMRVAACGGSCWCVSAVSWCAYHRCNPTGLAPTMTRHLVHCLHRATRNVCIVTSALSAALLPPTLQATTEEEVAAALQEAVQLKDKTVLIE